MVQARLQCETVSARGQNPEAIPRYEVLPYTGLNGEAIGLAALPPDHPADVFFDMEGYSLIVGGLEYLFGASTRTQSPDSFKFQDWWAHDREEDGLDQKSEPSDLVQPVLIHSQPDYFKLTAETFIRREGSSISGFPIQSEFPRAEADALCSAIHQPNNATTAPANKSTK